MVCSYRDEGYPVRDRLDYLMRPDPRMLRRGIERMLGPPRRDKRIGDILLMWAAEPERVDHVGVLVPGGRFVHVEIHSVVECVPLAGRWRRQLVAVYGVRP